MKEVTPKNINTVWTELQPGDYFKFSPQCLWTDVEKAARTKNLEVKYAGGFIGIIIRRTVKKKKKEILTNRV